MEADSPQPRPPNLLSLLSAPPPCVWAWASFTLTRGAPGHTCPTWLCFPPGAGLVQAGRQGFASGVQADSCWESGQTALSSQALQSRAAGPTRPEPARLPPPNALQDKGFSEHPAWAGQRRSRAKFGGLGSAGRTGKEGVRGREPRRLLLFPWSNASGALPAGPPAARPRQHAWLVGASESPSSGRASPRLLAPLSWRLDHSWAAVWEDVCSCLATNAGLSTLVRQSASHEHRPVCPVTFTMVSSSESRSQGLSKHGRVGRLRMPSFVTARRTQAEVVEQTSSARSALTEASSTGSATE